MIIRSDEFEDVAVPGGGTMRIHLFRPALEGRFPGVLFFSEIYQVTGPIRRLAALVAGQGYVVAVPEVYHEYEPAGTVLAYDQPGIAGTSSNSPSRWRPMMRMPARLWPF